MLLEHARDDIDRRLIEFGYNPWQVDDFCRLRPAERLREMAAILRWAARVRKSMEVTSDAGRYK